MLETHLEDIAARYEELNRLLAQPDVASDPDQLRRYAREHARLESIVQAWRQQQQATQELEEAQELLKDDDEEMRALASAEIKRLEATLLTLDEDIKLLLLPTDPLDEKNTLLEIRAGTGGDEAGLFAGDLLRMYERYADRRGWRLELLSASTLPIGGFKEVIALVSGEDVYSRMKFEGGVHRVQRVPATESQGRIHTSACTVAIMPEADAVDVDIDDNDLRIDFYRASGAGGQHVNKTDSAVRITHLPTNTVVQCQDEKSQHKNKARAMKILASRLLERQLAAQHSEQSAARRAQVGSGDRSERIRTYNYPQNRVTDHRIGLTLYKLDGIVEGDLDHVLDPLLAHFQAEALKAMGLVDANAQA